MASVLDLSILVWTYAQSLLRSAQAVLLSRCKDPVCGLCLRAVTQSPLATSTVRPSHQSLSLAEKLARWNEGGVGGGGRE